MASVRLLTCAKVNLFLRVLGERGDGYHEIETVFHGIDLCDTLSVAPTAPGSIAVRARFVDGAAGELPGVNDNLVTRAWRALEGPSRSPGVSVDIDKRIPVAAGLGGGSSNAAGALVALDELWGLGLDEHTLGEVALDLGSDVAFFLRGGTALGSGRGEVLEPLASASDLWFVLGISHRGLSTAEVYRQWRPAARPAPRAHGRVAALGAGDLETVARSLHNDLEPAAVYLRPELAAKKDALLRAGALAAVVCGSGPTLLGLAADRAQATAVARAVEDEFDRVEVAGGRRTCLERLRERSIR